MNYGSLSNEELLRYADTAPAPILAQRLSDAIDSEWTEEHCNTAYEDGARDGAKESDDAHHDFLAGILNDLEGAMHYVDSEQPAGKLLQAIAKSIEGEIL